LRFREKGSSIAYILVGLEKLEHNSRLYLLLLKKRVDKTMLEIQINATQCFFS
jgi:hypothetical protein